MLASKTAIFFSRSLSPDCIASTCCSSSRNSFSIWFLASARALSNAWSWASCRWRSCVSNFLTLAVNSIFSSSNSSAWLDLDWAECNSCWNLVCISFMYFSVLDRSRAAFLANSCSQVLYRSCICWSWRSSSRISFLESLFLWDLANWSMWVSRILTNFSRSSSHSFSQDSTISNFSRSYFTCAMSNFALNSLISLSTSFRDSKRTFSINDSYCWRIDSFSASMSLCSFASVADSSDLSL